MSRLDRVEPVAVNIGDCACAGSPHDEGDIVYLEAHLPLDGGLAANSVLIAFGDDPARLERELGLAYLLSGIVDWNLLDDDGKPIPVTPENVRALPWNGGGRIVAERANELYFAEVIGPLVERAAKLSVVGPTARSTSPRRAPKAGTRKPPASSSSATSAHTRAS